MSDQQHDASARSAQLMGKLHYFTPARYGHLLFAQGKEGWIDNGLGLYVRTIVTMPNQPFTTDDYNHCKTLLQKTHGFIGIASQYNALEMVFSINAKAMRLLVDRGLGESNSGTILAFESPEIAEDKTVALKNDPMGVLRENLRLVVHEQTRWHSFEKDSYHSVEARECEIVFPKTFMDKLAQINPHVEKSDAQLSVFIKEVLAELLPEVTVNVSAQSGPKETLFTIGVEKDYYTKLDVVIAEANAKPSTNVVNIERARGMRDAQRAP